MNAEIYSFYSIENKRVSFIKLSSGGQIMITTTNEHVSGMEHENLTNNIVKLINCETNKE